MGLPCGDGGTTSLLSDCSQMKMRFHPSVIAVAMMVLLAASLMLQLWLASLWAADPYSHVHAGGMKVNLLNRPVVVGDEREIQPK